jgi:hypothetical protein
MRTHKTGTTSGLFLLLTLIVLSGTKELRAQTTNATGTQQLFGVNQTEAATAVSNAFAQWRYKRMDLVSAKKDGLVSGWHGTNGWILFPLDGPITVTPWKNSNELVPYIPTFYIYVQPIETNITAVVVRTIDARVIHGKETGVHGGLANHEVNISPVLSEETNVLAAISNAVFTLKKHE